MNGADRLWRTLLAAGVGPCFTNPGTTELELMVAADRVDGQRLVLGLFEGVCTGAADGFARMTDRPASVLLHLGPGLANGLANLHNARRARSPIVVLVGDHDTDHRPNDPPLASDVEALARPMSSWVETARSAGELASTAVAAVAAARRPPGGIATLVIPADAMRDPAGESVPIAVPSPPGVQQDAVDRATHALALREPAMLLMSGKALRARGLRAASRIARATGARVFCDTWNARLERGTGLPVVERLPYFPEHAVAALSGCRHLVLVETNEPVAFFAYPGQPRRLAPPGSLIHQLARPEDDGIAALEALADAVGATSESGVLQQPVRAEAAPGRLTLKGVAAHLTRALPEGAIVVDEANSGSLTLFPALAGAAPHDWLFLTGGSIGQGLPLATGAAIACPDRKVVCVHADGGALYTLQALWTQARERLDVVTILLDNGGYRVLRLELARAGVPVPGPKAASTVDLNRPAIDWIKLSEGFGVEASYASSSEAFADQLGGAMGVPGPRLIVAKL